MTKVRALLADSQSGEIYTLQAPLLLSARMETAKYIDAVKAASDPTSRGSARLRQKLGVPMDGVQCATRPFDFALYAYAATIATYHGRAVRAKTKDITGGKWSITGEGSEANKKKVTDFFTRAFGKQSFAEGMGCVWTDREALGNGFLEVVPDRQGKPAELAHLPAPEMWIRLDEMGYVQFKNSEYAHFRDYNTDPKKYGDLKSTDPLREGTARTSVIHFSRYSPWSPFYGVPSIMTAWNAVVLWTLISEYNLGFFTNSAIPDYAVIIEGEAGDDVISVVQEYFRTGLKGQHHKTLVMEAPGGGKIHFEKLTSDNAKEGSFRLLRTDCRDEMLHAHGVPPQKVGIVETGKLGGNLASEQIEEYKNSIVNPGREAVTTALNRIIQDPVVGFGFPDLEFTFEPYDTEDRAANATVDGTYLDRGVVTPNEVRAERYPDRDPLPDGDVPLNHGGGLNDLAGVSEQLAQLQRDMVRIERQFVGGNAE